MYVFPFNGLLSLHISSLCSSHLTGPGRSAATLLWADLLHTTLFINTRSISQQRTATYYFRTMGNLSLQGQWFVVAFPSPQSERDTASTATRSLSLVQPSNLRSEPALSLGILCDPNLLGRFLTCGLDVLLNS